MDIVVIMSYFGYFMDIVVITGYYNHKIIIITMERIINININLQA